MKIQENFTEITGISLAGHFIIIADTFCNIHRGQKSLRIAVVTSMSYPSTNWITKKRKMEVASRYRQLRVQFCQRDCTIYFRSLGCTAASVHRRPSSVIKLEPKVIQCSRFGKIATTFCKISISNNPPQPQPLCVILPLANVGQ